MFTYLKRFGFNSSYEVELIFLVHFFNPTNKNEIPEKHLPKLQITHSNKGVSRCTNVHTNDIFAKNYVALLLFILYVNKVHTIIARS